MGINFGRRITWLCAIFGTAFLALVFVRIVWACSPVPNLHIICGVEELSVNIYVEENLIEALESCPEFMPALETLESLVLAADVAETWISTAVERSAHDFPAKDFWSVQSECYELLSAEHSDYSIGYTRRYSFCNGELSIGCPGFRIAPFKKMVFDWQQGSRFGLSMLITTVIASITLGISIGKAAHTYHKFDRPYRFAQPPPAQILARTLQLIGYGVLGLLCVVPLFLFLLPVFNWLLFPSALEFVARSSIVSFLCSYAAVQFVMGIQARFSK